MQNRKILRLLLSFIVVLALLLSLTGCKDKNKPTIETTKATKTTEPITKEKTTEESTDETTSDTGKTSGKSGGGSGGSGGSGGGGGGGQAQGTTKAPATTAAKSNSYYAPQVYYNSASGAAVQALADGTQIDYSNAASGYVMLKYSGAHSNVRLQVAAPDGVTPVYPIFSTGWEAIPLTNGNGNYTFRVLANDGGNSYTVVGSVDIPVTLSYSTAAFYRPNIYCNYDGGTSCVNYAAELTRGCDTEVAKIQAIYNYVVGNFHYDYGKASSVASAAYVPNLNSVWASKSGICFDYASTMAAMLRTQGLPTRVCIGYVNGSTYHAWISVYVQGTGWVNNIIQFNGNSWKLMDPTFASTGGNKYDWSQRGSYSAMYYY